MTTDLICLLLLALWSIPLNHAPAIGRIVTAGAEWGMGNRDTQPEGLPVWVGRADRAQRNHHDNLAMIAVVILIAQATGQADAATATSSIVIQGRLRVRSFRVWRFWVFKQVLTEVRHGGQTDHSPAICLAQLLWGC